MTYSDKLKDVRWKRLRNKIIKRDRKCQKCGSKRKLQVHHSYYEYDLDPWEYDQNTLYVLCAKCHNDETLDVRELNNNIKEMLKSGLFAREIILTMQKDYD